MSYGWLTESALIPKPAVPINVDNSSILDLKVMLGKEKHIERGAFKAKVPEKKAQYKNKGVEERMKRDLAETLMDSEAAKLSLSSTILQRKADLYEKQQKSNVSVKHSLVDFQLKKIDNMTEQEKDNYEKEKEEFYRDKKIELENLQRHMISQRPSIGNPTLGFAQAQQEVERNQWEQEVLNDLENELHDVNKELTERVLVQQTYDKKLSKFEKEKLVTVLTEEVEAKGTLNELKRKRQEADEIRREKLRKIVCKQK